MFHTGQGGRWGGAAAEFHAVELGGGGGCGAVAVGRLARWLASWPLRVLMASSAPGTPLRSFRLCVSEVRVAFQLRCSAPAASAEKAAACSFAAAARSLARRAARRAAAPPPNRGQI